MAVNEFLSLSVCFCSCVILLSLGLLPEKYSVAATKKTHRLTKGFLTFSLQKSEPQIALQSKGVGLGIEEEVHCISI